MSQSPYKGFNRGYDETLTVALESSQSPYKGFNSIFAS